MSGEETEAIVIESIWRAAARVEVPKGWRPGSRLDDWPEEVLEQVTADGAELIDWSSS